MLKDWCTDNKLISMYQDITKIIEMATLIPPSTVEVERSFSLMNLISTPQRKRLSAENLGHCMRICKYPRVLPRMIINKPYCNCWKVLEPNQKAAESIIVYRTKKRTFSICIFILFVFDMLEGKKRRYCINFFLLYAHKSRTYFLFFLKSLKFLKPRYFLKYKSNVLKYS